MGDVSTVVVSGAGTGIGRAVALRLGHGGVHVTAVGRRADRLQELSEVSPGTVDVIAADLCTPAGADQVAEHLRVRDARCTGVVAAAGGLTDDSGLPGLPGIRSEWLASFDANVLTAVLLVEALRPALQEAAGRVVCLSSVAALRGSGGGPYGAMKAALHAWTFDLAAELGPFGGTANVVAPGFVPDTGFWEGRLTEESRGRRAAQTLVGREGTPEEVASLITWLLGPDGGWITGQVLSPNGGLVLGR